MHKSTKSKKELTLSLRTIVELESPTQQGKTNKVNKRYTDTCTSTILPI